MLRTFFIFLSKATWAQYIVTKWKFAWRAASRFVAGNTIHDAIRVVKDLNAKGIVATVDHLGESTSIRGDAIEATNEVIALLNEINCCNVRANVSVKLTQIGLSLDEELCINNLHDILKCAEKNRNFLRIDMEDTPYTDQTIKLFRLMRTKGYENVGIVVQSYLYRTEKDTKDLLAEGSRFRLVKGAYKEPANKAYPKKADVDANFDLLTKMMLDLASKSHSLNNSPDGRIPPIIALGTHDPKRIRFGKEYASSIGLPKEALEFQMLFGIRRDLQEECIREGYPVRVYVPYGAHWYPFFMRRIAERPANLIFFLGNYFKK